jgi:hypothetical protein
MHQSRSRGTELSCTVSWEGLSLLTNKLSRMRSSSGEEQQEIILKSLREAEWPVLSRWERILDMVGLLLLLPVRGETPKCSDTCGCKWRIFNIYLKITISAWFIDRNDHVPFRWNGLRHTSQNDYCWYFWESLRYQTIPVTDWLK